MTQIKTLRASRRIGFLSIILGASFASGARADTDWVLVLDRSESMTQNDPYSFRFDAQKIMVDLLAQGVEETDRLTIIRFAGTPETVLDREVIRPEKLATIRHTIAQDPPRGDTDIGAALALARKTAKPEGRASDVHVILMTDGVQAGKIPNLAGRLEEEKKACQELGLAVNTILLNDYSIVKEDREERRKKKLYYDDRVLQAGEDLLRDIARKTGGQSAQVLPDRGIEDILIELIAPHMSFYREAVSGRLETWPTDRQLFFVLDRKDRDVKLRIGQQEMDLSLERAQQVGGAFQVDVNPYRNRTVVMVRPDANVRWPEWVELLPGPSRSVVSGDVFVISNVRLATLPGLDSQAQGSPESVKTKIQENEVYPIRFRVAVPTDLTPERARSIQDALKKSSVRIELRDAQGKLLDEKALSAADVVAGAGNRLYFIPTSSPRGETKIEEPFYLNVRARLEYGDASAKVRAEKRPLCRAPDRAFIVSPSSFDWLLRRNWKGEPESSSRPVGRRDVEVELGQELRLEVAYSGRDSLGDAEMSASFGQAGDTAARRLPLKDGGGVPHAFFTDWIFPPAPGEYVAKMTVKAGGVQEVAFAIRVLRDDFRLPGSEYAKDGTDTARGRDLGSLFQSEKVEFARARTINRLTPEATQKYWEAEAASPAKAYLLKKDAASGSWTILRQAPLSSDAPTLGTTDISVNYRGTVSDLEPGDYLIAWPEKRPLGPDPAADQRSDRFEVKPLAFSGGFSTEDGKPLESEGGKPTALAGARLVFRVIPSKVFPEPFGGTVTGTLTWARKDVGSPQVVKATRGKDGAFTMLFPTTDFHTGPARLHLAVAWKDGSVERSIEEDYEVFARTKALGVAIEPIEEDVLIGQRGAAVRFRIRAIGGENAQAQRDLLSVWQSQQANATIGDSESIHRIDLTAEGEALTGSLDAGGLASGTYKLVVSSPIAKLGQDIAACFFNVKPCPFSVTLVKTSLGTDQRVVLGPGVESARCEGEGAVWVSLERSAGASSKAGERGGKIVSAELKLNGKKADVRWSEAEGKFRSEPLPLESLERQNSLALSITDESGRSFETSIGSLEVQAVPIKYEVAWTSAPPAELGRGEHVRIEGAVQIRGGLRSQRDQAGKAFRATPFLASEPASALEGFEVLPRSGDAKDVDDLFGVRIAFAAVLKAAAGNSELKDGFTLTVASKEQGGIESRKVAIGPSTRQLLIGRSDAQGAISPEEELPLFAREKSRVKIEGQTAQEGCRIQIFTADDGAAAASIASAAAPMLSWAPKKEGVYRITAEASLGPGSGWATEEKVTVLPALRLEWAHGGPGVIKLDDGQKLPLSIRISGPPTLDRESFDRWYALRSDVLGEGGQPLSVELTEWETDKESTPGRLVLSAYSSKALSSSAAKVRVALVERLAEKGAGTLDTMDLDVVRGGGSLVAIDHFERGPAGYAIRDLSPGFELVRESTIRLGYRAGGIAESDDSLKHGVAAIVVSPDGSEKVLDVEATGQGLVVFTSYEAGRLGQYSLRLEIRGKAPLRRDFQFEVVKGSSDRAIVGGMIAAGGVLLSILVLLGMKGLAYSKDKRTVLERVNARKDKVLNDLGAEPKQSLTGSVRLTIANKSIGPLELNGNASPQQVEAWVDQHFSMESAIFSDAKKNEKRRDLIQSCLAEARTELCLETEKRLPILGADVCITEVKDGGKSAPKLEAVVVHDGSGRKVEGQKTLLSLRLLGDGKLRVSTTSGRSVQLSTSEDFAYNGWIGKSGSQVRASVKVPGVADYSTLIIDLKS